ncbi:hypothetical protein F4677DRAFT_434149 [Hypoxylon crocopeplum]|nr:hypothetical protein F4677DRAFT_434149 [Hypoxylon crocopeplum]
MRVLCYPHVFHVVLYIVKVQSCMCIYYVCVCVLYMRVCMRQRMYVCASYVCVRASCTCSCMHLYACCVFLLVQTESRFVWLEQVSSTAWLSGICCL